jgi:tetratricopeptide (TPR) repeat protein
MLRGPVLDLAFRPDGRTLLAVDDRGRVDSWPVPVPSDEPIERLIRRVELRSGLRLDAAGAVVVLDPETWRRHRAELGDPPRTSIAADDRAWHDVLARDAAAAGNGSAARWHLERMIPDRPGAGLLRARLAGALLMEGDSGSARSELARAIELGPRARVLDWMLQRAEDLRASGRREDALLLLDQVLAAGPDDDWLVHALRAEALAALGRTAEREAELDRAAGRGSDIPFLIRLAAERGRAGRWTAAVELYDRAIAQGTVPYEVWEQAAVAHLELDDHAGYGRVCDAMRYRHPAEWPEWWGVAWALARVCTLGPGGIDAEGKARKWAEDTLAGVSSDRAERKHQALGLLGAILYRSGRHRAAIDRISEGIAAEDGAMSPDELAVLAMAYHASGDRATAVEMLAKAVANEPNSPASSFWDAEVIRLLCREAERLILDRPFPVDPFAP